jgi:hypothetical protein
MGGSNAPPEKTDWTPLAGKTVLIWPDNDEPDEKGRIAGQVYAENARKAIAGSSPRSWRTYTLAGSMHVTDDGYQTPVRCPPRRQQNAVKGTPYKDDRRSILSGMRMILSS